MRKLVLVVIDAMKPEMLERAIASGRAPALARIVQEGVYVNDVVAAFPSVTPVCAATITTGVGPDRHLIPGMNWYHRGEGRYVEYGTSFSATRQFGFLRSLTDTIYRMNAEHLSVEVPTVFESLDDIGVRTAGTTYLIYRGRHPHEVAQETPLAALIAATLFRRTVLGPRELFYADLYASRHTGCHGQLGLPGARDQHSGCVGSYLVERDLCDFLLFSLPDNDAWSHRNGPRSQVSSIAAADRQLERLMHAAGGADEFLSEYAVIVTSDHSHTLVERNIRLDSALADFRVATARSASSKSGQPEMALCPSQRGAMIYVLQEERRHELIARARDSLLSVPGVDLAMHLVDADPAGGVAGTRHGHPGRHASEAAIVAAGGHELRFAPGGDVIDPRGAHWYLEGDLDVLSARIEDGCLQTPDYPDALTRAWSALTCETSGDLLLSAGPGFEFVDWGGADHVGGGSHGSLHRSDSLGALLWCGTGPDTREARAQWSLRDVTPMIRAHFGAPEPVSSGVTDAV